MYVDFMTGFMLCVKKDVRMSDVRPISILGKNIFKNIVKFSGTCS